MTRDYLEPVGGFKAFIPDRSCHFLSLHSDKHWVSEIFVPFSPKRSKLRGCQRGIYVLFFLAAPNLSGSNSHDRQEEVQKNQGPIPAPPDGRTPGNPACPCDPPLGRWRCKRKLGDRRQLGGGHRPPGRR